VAERIADLDLARDAVAREAWAEAYAAFQAVDPSTLTPGDLEGLADAAWWLSRMEESIAARQRAYAGQVAAGCSAGRQGRRPRRRADRRARPGPPAHHPRPGRHPHPLSHPPAQVPRPDLGGCGRGRLGCGGKLEGETIGRNGARAPTPRVTSGRASR
jgi:hypothetical protein